MANSNDITSSLERLFLHNSEFLDSVSFSTLFEKEFLQIDSRTFKKKESDGGGVLKARAYSIRLHKLVASLSSISSPTTKKSLKTLRSNIKRRFEIAHARHLVHAICALYDNSLPDMGISTIYDCICDPKAVTVFLFEDDEDSTSPSSLIVEDVKSSGSASSVEYDDEDCLENLEDDSETESKSVFQPIFTESSESEDEDDGSDEEDSSESESEEQDFSVGIATFISEYSKKKLKEKEKEKKTNLSFVSRLIGCCTLKKVHTCALSCSKDKLEAVIDLELLCVRKKHRGCQIGKFFLNLAKNTRLVGEYDAIVTSSDFDAVEFYEKQNFTLDPILCSKYHEIGDLWTNTKKMCYIPPYSQITGLETKDDGGGTRNGPSDLAFSYETDYIRQLDRMEKDFKSWQKLMFNAYQSQSQLFVKLKRDITNLNARLMIKDETIDELKVENDLLKRKYQFVQIKLDSLLDISE